jgi:iron complex transport system substrate-binding protein
VFRSRTVQPATPAVPRRRVAAVACALALAALALPSAALAGTKSAATAYPLELTNCGRTETIPAAPQRAITTNEGATEIMLELGLGNRMAGTAYLDDARVYPPLARAYAKVPVVAKEYPSTEVVLSKNADFVYGSYVSAFAKDGAGTRPALESHGMNTYLSPSNCIAKSRSIAWNDVYGEITDIGKIFDVQDRAAALVAKLEARLAAAQKLVASTGDSTSVFWYDSGAKAPTAGACCGAPGLIVRTAGGKNIFSALKGGWQDGSWEQVVAQNPDVIVLVNATWDTVAAKHKVLAKSPLSGLAAVRDKHFVIVPFGSSTPSFRNVDAVVALAKEIKALHG